MLNIQQNDIIVTRGDSLLLRITLQDADLPEGTEARFTVKRRPRDEEPAVEKTFALEEDTVTLYLAPGDTNLPPGTYYWDLRLIIPHEGEEDEVRTPMEYAAFTVLEAIGDV